MATSVPARSALRNTVSTADTGASIFGEYIVGGEA